MRFAGIFNSRGIRYAVYYYGSDMYLCGVLPSRKLTALPPLSNRTIKGDRKRAGETEEAACES